ncbi:Gfo/Idh/MocA family oxidoreductase [Gaetbulibacter sp. M240]|uniref:Gfo/Idh/MocA family protein n=1 Tax=Gaetbulibacter sp. M240 TaxID=3126511 RepID=UPI00374F6AA3
MKLKNERRKFLKNTSLAVGGVLLSQYLLHGENKNLDEKTGKVIRVGVVGVGDRGSGHMRLIKKIDALKVVAYCDVIPFRLESAMKLAPDAKGYKDYRDLLDDKNVDAVIIATPYSMHGKMALDTLNAGKHVFCEKTMIRGYTETQKVLDKVNSGNLIFMTGHQHRSSPLYQKVKNIIDSGYIGDLVEINCQWNRNNDWRRVVSDQKWERMINWRMYREYSGGLVAELLSHQIDIANWYTNSQLTKITGIGGIDFYKDGRETFDNVHVNCKYENGVTLSLSSTTANAYGGYEIRILGRKGTIVLSREKGHIYSENSRAKKQGLVDGVSGATQAWESAEGWPIDADGQDSTMYALNDFVEAIFTNQQPISNVKTGAVASKSVDIILDALHSEEEKFWKDYPKMKLS